MSTAPAQTTTGSAVRRWTARVSLAGAVLCLAFAGLADAGAQEAPPPRPDVFSGAASSEVASVFADREALIPVPEALRFIAADGTGTYTSSNQTARASIFYPGAGVIQGPVLACGTFGSSAPPEFKPVIDACLGTSYPLTVFADSLNPDGTSTGAAALGDDGDQISAKGVRAVAHAAPDAAFSDAAVNELQLLGLPPVDTGSSPLPGLEVPELDATVLSIEGATSTTDQRIDAKGVLVVRSEAALTGVRLVGGLVEIGSIRSMTEITDDGRGNQTQEADLEISGVVVGGIPAQITEDGLVVGSPTGADGPLAQQLTSVVNELVRNVGFEVTALEVDKGVDEAGLAFARSGGLLVEFGVDVQGTPIVPGPNLDLNGLYKGVIQLGKSGANGIAVHIDDPVFDPDPDGDFGLPVDFSGSDTGTAAPIRQASTTPGTTTGSGSEAAAPTAPAAPDQQLVSFIEELYADRIRLLYLAFTLIALALCLGPRLVLPARLPRSST